MDMKRILQAFDSASTKPVEGASDMSKFLSIINKNDVAVLNEGANPHKVALPVQMAMQHYQQPKETKPKEPSLLERYFKEVNDEILEQEAEKKQLLRQYASTIAKRVMVKESSVPDHSPGFTGGVGPGLQNNIVDETPIDLDIANPMSSTIHSHKGANPGSIEYRIMRARNQLKDLAQQALSNDPLVWQRIGRLLPELQMNIEQVAHGLSELGKEKRKGGVRSKNIPRGLDEVVMPKIKATTPKTIKPKAKTSVCKAGQVQTGMQTKDGKSVPKCSVK